VRNYGVRDDGIGDFSGDPDDAMFDLQGGENSFATVCMVKFGSTLADPNGNDVQFFVYDANDDLANRAQLDSFNSNDAIPNNCLNCHGGKLDERSSTIVGSTFLPFDPEAFSYLDEEGFSFEEQEDAFRALNAMMKNAGGPPSTKQWVDGVYQNKANVAGTKAQLDFIPPGWSGSEEAKTVYREVYKPYCRTCHTSQFGEFAFMTYDDFKASAAKTMDAVCNTHEMPLAEATMILFWDSPARAYLLNSFETSASCSPRDR
jgi:mono/diheme cytochrome c family protein